METNKLKEVYFTYCESCEFKDVEQSEDPCHDCLNEPVNEWSHKPVNYKEK